ncbi:MAG: palindromic element RPE2 domain-containing protein [Rickettsia endosymbiont of Gnoriste bilineata]|nr:palindromic element RPE2 domain-containing protein [Rickettsia endosymbiont of Gnoriste bilineata]
MYCFVIISIVNSGECGARNDGATPISNRRATSDDVTNFPSIDYNCFLVISHLKIDEPFLVIAPT